MSRKQFISAEEHLAKLGVTVQQAFDFIVANVDKPEVIFSAARQYGVTNDMLSEITNATTIEIHDYFVNAGIDSIQLDWTSLLINSDLGSLEHLVDFNDNTGILSNASIREAVQPLIFLPDAYLFTWETIYDFAKNDGNYDAEELGVDHLIDVPATDESIESLFYGTLIKIFSALDQAELDEINVSREDGSSEEFQVLLLDALSESPSSTTVWTDEQLAELVTNEAVNVIDKFWTGEIEFVGVLDHSFLGLATA